MASKTRRKKSSSKSGGSRTGGKKARGKRTATGLRKSASRRATSATKTLQNTAVKVMAGAAAGAVRAMIPPLEEAAGTSERAAGLAQRSRSKGGKSGKSRNSGR